MEKKTVLWGYGDLHTSSKKWAFWGKNLDRGEIDSWMNWLLNSLYCTGYCRKIRKDVWEKVVMLDFGLSLGEQVCKSMHTALPVVLANHAQPVSFIYPSPIDILIVIANSMQGSVQSKLSNTCFIYHVYMYMLRYLIKNFLLAVFAHRMTIVISIYYGEGKTWVWCLGCGCVVWQFYFFLTGKSRLEKNNCISVVIRKMKIIVNRILPTVQHILSLTN